MYRQFGAYYLIPAIWNEGMSEPRFLTHLPVLKRALNVFLAEDLTEQDIELIAMKQAVDRSGGT